VFIATIIPQFSFSKAYFMNIVAVLGTTISPYLFFWQANEEVEEEIAHHKLRNFGAGLPRVMPKDIKNLRIDTTIGMFFSNAVMWFIIITTGTVLYTNNMTQISSAQEAAAALRPLAGDLSYFLFAAGIVGTGLLAVPILSGSASYAVSEMLSWNAGLSLKLKKAHGFYGVMTIATLFGLLINFIGINPMAALYYTAILNGFISPPLLLIVLLIANNKKIVGEQVNTKWQNGIGILTILLMSLSALALLYQLVIH
jgi:Mn2+/Fe2+ NRAMP family transporter